MTNLDDVLRRRPVDRERVNALKRQMLDEVRAYRLRELREESALTQVELASRMNVTQARVSHLESGEIDRAQLDTLRKYAEAIGGELRVEIALGDQVHRIA
ncbi:helix-turn-helix transcriptional regulator [Microcella sp.]|uniref:helix-turn-helix domain-containing protein n=1 Tax=Microcella sp. TaxID=1913979 RepID=UPI00299F7362|nr:helix-turn-helix transcriptional regulator [Microcella sp.]MDX2026890.1 helix-turn-helix transcriptional regulator [Microcella sp.]